MISGRSLELFFVDGNPDGMLTAEVFKWPGHVLRVPRTRLAEGLRRKEARQTGVYILLGQNEDGHLAYIGEAETMSERLKNHAISKDWWDQVVMITTYGDALHKAHVKYLESRLVETALSAANTKLENGNVPPKSSLNEAALANMESFLKTLHMVLPAIRIDLFQTGKRSNAEKSANSQVARDSQDFELLIPKSNAVAYAYLLDDEIVVKSGSYTRREWVGTKKHNSHYWRMFDELVERGIIEITDDLGRFTEDYAFSSPSAAAAVVSGRSTNGRTKWKTPNGKTYAQWEASKLESEGDEI